MIKGRTVIALAALAAASCSLMPQRHVRLEEARRAYQEAAADPQVALHAGTELRLAAELLEQASRARDTLDDAANVDHLAYVAKQRVAIARESAKLRAKEP